MFRNVPACSGMFHVPGFIDGLCLWRAADSRCLFYAHGDYGRPKTQGSSPGRRSPQGEAGEEKRQEVDSFTFLTCFFESFFQDNFKVLTINARGLGSPLNNNLLFDLIEKSVCDICFVQETLVSSEANIKVLSRRWLGRSYWPPSIDKQGGVAVLFSPKCSGEVVSWKKDSNGRIISILVRIDGVDLNFVNIYAPTNRTDRKLFYESLHEYFVPASALVIGGDFNCYENALDKFGGNVSVGGECKSVKSDFVLVDAWRKLHPSAREFTWFNHDYSIASRLDKFFFFKGVVYI